MLECMPVRHNDEWKVKEKQSYEKRWHTFYDFSNCILLFNSYDDAIAWCRTRQSIINSNIY